MAEGGTSVQVVTSWWRLCVCHKCDAWLTQHRNIVTLHSATPATVCCYVGVKTLTSALWSVMNTQHVENAPWDACLKVIYWWKVWLKKKIHKIVFQWRPLRTICEKMLMAYGVKVLGMNFLLCCKKALVGILCIHQYRCQKWGTLFCWHRPLCCHRLGRQPRVCTGTSPGTVDTESGPLLRSHRDGDGETWDETSLHYFR